MADEVNENIFLVNAPAGSGKTTWIRQQVESYLLHNPKDNILCITYTNRAAEELGRDLEQSRVYFGTIHSFINDFIGSFFSHKEIIDLYWEVYETQIIERIRNIEQKKTWIESNERYKEKYGSLDLDIVRSNINKISYNETPFNSLLYGGLGHNDLITFTKLAVDRFPIIKKKISDKYQLIFIDEYQDTSADVLHIFYTSLVGKKSKLYLLGDKMQQIYKNYNGEFEEKLETFNRSVNLSINYRTTPKIVDILNYIYNDEALKQYPYEKNSREMNYILDNLTAKQRRKNMQHIKNKDTLIELKLRTKLWNKGYRYRKNVNNLPGKPDIVLPKYKIAIFCDSEFFHGKDWDALKSRLEKSNNSEYWIKKISRNRQRDDEINKKLSFMGWTVVRFLGKEILTNSDECVSVIEDIIWSQKTNLDGSEMIDKEELL